MEMLYYTLVVLILLSLCFYMARHFGALAEFIQEGQELTKQEKVGLGFLKSKKALITFMVLSIVFIALSYFTFDPWSFKLLYAGFSILLIASFLMDVSVKLLPDVFTISLLWLGLLASTLGIMNVMPAEAIIAAATMYLGFMLIDVIGELIFKKEVIGGGDIKLMAAFGAMFGIMQSIVLLIVACGIMLIFVLGLKVCRKIHDRELPFGLGLTLAALINIFYPNLVLEIMNYLAI